MTLQFTVTPGNPGNWVAETGEVTIWVADEDGAPNAAQVVAAHRIVESLPALETRAAKYLDMFVDRARACGNGEERWWLGTIDLVDGYQVGSFSYRFSFYLAGDDGGLWAVYFMALDNDRPFRFERLQV